MLLTLHWETVFKPVLLWKDTKYIHLILWVPVCSTVLNWQLSLQHTFCWLNGLFCYGNKRFVVFEVLATFETLANTRWKQQNQLADVWKEHSVSCSPEHRDLSIPSHPWLKAAPRLQCWGDDLLSPWLTSIIELHFLSYCILKRDHEQQSFFAHEISVNVLLLFKNSRTTILLTQNITLVVLCSVDTSRKTLGKISALTQGSLKN